MRMTKCYTLINTYTDILPRVQFIRGVIQAENKCIDYVDCSAKLTLNVYLLHILHEILLIA